MPRLVVQHTFSVSGANLVTAAFDGAGHLFVAGEKVNAVLVVDTASGALARKVPFKGAGLAIGLSPAGTRLAVGGRAGAVLDLGTDARLGDFKTKLVMPHDYAWSPDGAYFARSDGNLVLVHDADGALVKKHLLPKQKIAGEVCAGQTVGLAWRDAATVVALASYTRTAGGHSESDWERRFGFATCTVGGELALGALRDGFPQLGPVAGTTLGILAVTPSGLGNRAPRPATLELVDLVTLETKKQAVLAAQTSNVQLVTALDADTAIVGWRTTDWQNLHGVVDLRGGGLARLEGAEGLGHKAVARADGLLAFVMPESVVLGRLQA